MPNPKKTPCALHIVQGGIQNGDKALLERLARSDRGTRSWVAPKSVAPGDEIVIFIQGLGFFATARATSLAAPRADWKNRYGADLGSIRLIEPPVSLAAIRCHVPGLEWAKYPRSITTPTAKIADRIRELISARRKHQIDLDDDFLGQASLEELRMVALSKASRSLSLRKRQVIQRAASAAIRRYVLTRANGRCEGCLAAAPFRTCDGRLFLEAHHTMRKADGGPDHPSRVIGLCPNCHKRAHLAADADSFNESLIRKLPKLEAAAGRRQHAI